jgi:hypothetical protein
MGTCGWTKVENGRVGAGGENNRKPVTSAPGPDLLGSFLVIVNEVWGNDTRRISRGVCRYTTKSLRIIFGQRWMKRGEEKRGYDSLD